MFNIVKKEVNWGGKTLTLETGKIARQAGGSVIVTYGDTVMLGAVTVSKKPLEGADFLPMTVNYLEKSYAAGKIPGGFFKREAKPSDFATLTSRMIDRPIRPLFPAGFHHEINVVCQILSYDASANPDVVALIAASAALSLSEAPFEGPVAGARVGYTDGNFTLNPSNEELENSDLDLVVAGTSDSVLMVESEAKQLTEAKMLEAVKFGHDAYKSVIDAIKELAKEAGKEKVKPEEVDNSALIKEVSDFAKDDISKAYDIKAKQERVAALDGVKTKVKEKFVTEGGEIDDAKIGSIFKKVEQEVVRGQILAGSTRIDGRKSDEVRQIETETGFLPKVHGCALFTRGETQAIVVATLGSDRDEQMVETLDPEIRKDRFLLHYNFPPYSVGEVGRLGVPGRREIGHGKLAWRAINPVLPKDQEVFPYVTRVVSEITESNGSSSMATVCGTSMALMDAGVPLEAPVSGIAMGLVKDGDKYVVLSDIMGDEDHLGDMDFKVAGTRNGITALQMDIKIKGITAEIMEEALKQANAGRNHILDRMEATIKEPNTELNANIPRVETLVISQNKIKDIIGSRGKTIKEICAVSGAVVDVDDSGTVKVSANSNDAIQKAVNMINEICFEPEIGDIFEGAVVKTIDAGAFVTISENKDGFVHISELADYRVEFVEDVINEGDMVKVKVIGFDKKGRPKLSYRCVDQETGEDISDQLENVGGGDKDKGDRKPRRDNRDSRDGGRESRDGGRDNRRDRDDRKKEEDKPKKKRGFFS